MKYAIFAGLNSGFGGALSADETDEACMALTTIKLYIQSSVPRAE